MKADAEHDLFNVKAFAVGVGDGLLELNCSRQRIDGTGELDQGAISSELN
jgi:hypothetical protein